MVNATDTFHPPQAANQPLLCIAQPGELTRKNWLKARPPDREKLRSDYSLLQSSDLRVEAALKLSTVNCQLSTVEVHPGCGGISQSL
ncbi:hypothetical protein [Microcoleus sp. CAWBG58]|uniref:hypothetical protein n=1 Tax=Microcoleus sp. CAWBG58 TaxID=2841651 RepID=UPI0025DDFF54|nr:hypothetical protein [Microcoleus sp. CAWBG58]